MQPHLNENWFSQERRSTISAHGHTTLGEEAALAHSLPPAHLSPAFENEAYVWQVYGKPVTVELNLAVVDRLQQDLYESAYYGNEVLGILIGRVHKAGAHSVISVEDYHLAANTSDSAASPLAKQKQLADIVGAWNAGCGDMRAVGLVRSQSDGWVALAQQDVEAAKCLFPKNDNIFLIVRSSPNAEPKAGFFFWEGNHIQADESYSEFTFDSRVLRRQSAPHVQVLNTEPEKTGETFTPSIKSRKNSWLAVGLTWGAALACTLTCVSAWNTKDPNPNEPAAETAINVTPVSNPSKFKVEVNGEPMEIHLNHGLPSDLEQEHGPLSDRQQQLLRYFAEDMSKDEIASRLGISPEAVEVHKQALAHKLGVTGDAGLVRYAIKSGLAQP